MSKHTPGSWVVGIRHPCRIIGEDNVVATACDSVAEGTETTEQKANARLIAAAPDLLAACKLLCQAWDDDFLGAIVTRIATYAALDAFINPARAAIAKAEGEENE